MTQQLTTLLDCTQQFMSEIDRLRQLEDGWCEPESKAVVPTLLDIAVQLVDYISVHPGVAPTHEGGVQLIWEDFRCYCELTPSMEMQLVGPGDQYLTFDMSTQQGKRAAIDRLLQSVPIM